MQSASKQTTNVGAAIARPLPRAMMLRWLALPLVLLAMAPAEAVAQLGGLGGGGPLGGIGGVGGIGGIGGIGGSVGLGNTIGVPGSNGIPDAPSNSIIGPKLNIPLGGPAAPSLPNTGSVANTLNGTTSNALALPGRVTNGLGNTVNQAVRRTQAASPRRRSGVPPAGETRFVGGEVMLRLPSSLTDQALDALARRHGLTRLESQRMTLTGTTFHRWRINGGRPVSDIIRALEAESGVSAAQPNYRYTLAQQPQARGTSADISDAQYALAKLHLPQAHRFATGDRVLIAVIDSGIETAHPEIDGFIAGSFDALNSKEPPHSHGTAMAGAIVAHARLMGVAPAARILAIRAFGANGSGAEGTTLTLLRAIDWAVAHKARIINMSFAGPSDPEVARALAAAHKKGVVLVAAAGNAGAKSPPLFPAADANVIAVTATDAGDKLFKLANRGKYITVAAPGVEILGPSTNGGYQISTGTSVAAAQVSGVAALLLERKPDLRPDALRKILASTATDLGPKGQDSQYGAGLVNAYRAVQSLVAVAVAPRGKTRNASVAPGR